MRIYAVMTVWKTPNRNHEEYSRLKLTDRPFMNKTTTLVAKCDVKDVLVHVTFGRAPIL